MKFFSSVNFNLIISLEPTLLLKLFVFSPLLYKIHIKETISTLSRSNFIED